MILEVTVKEWEHRILRELYLDYEQVLRSRKVAMKAALLVLSDSETFWGRWIEASRTIEISRKLVREQPWFQVLAILRHEMAHQYVDEYRLDEADGPHGAGFKKACAILGVPNEYRGASVNLQTHSLDWRTERRDDHTEKMLERVRKLLALATSTNENEAALAMTRVREIYARHNLETKSAAPDFVHSILVVGGKRLDVTGRAIASILIEHFFVHVVVGEQFDATSLSHQRVIEIIGRRENVLMAEYVYHFLREQSHRLTDEYAKRSSTRVARRSYRLGILHGFEKKLHQALTSKSPSAAAEYPIVSRALTSFRNDPELKDYVSKVYPRLGRTRNRGTQVDLSAYSAGQKTGQQMTLHKPVTSARSSSARPLLSFSKGR